MQLRMISRILQLACLVCLLFSLYYHNDILLILAAAITAVYVSIFLVGGGKSGHIHIILSV